MERKVIAGTIAASIDMCTNTASVVRDVQSSLYYNSYNIQQSHDTSVYSLILSS